MTSFIKSGSTIRPTHDADMTVTNYLPVGTYTVMKDQYGNFFLSIVDDFKIEGKIYGNANSRSERVINTFKDRSGNTGIILQGDKGSGKTLLAKLTSAKLREQNIPTILVNQDFSGEPFNNFLQSINQPCMVMFDEFEKVYGYDSQNALLTLFDGIHASKKLFVITCNEAHRVNNFMRNRPGRFYYMFEYAGLENDFITDYCKDNLHDQDHIKSILNFAGTFTSFNFDILKALVEEMNRYDEPVSEVVKYLNASPMSDVAIYKVRSMELTDPELANKYKKFDEEVSNGQEINIFHGNHNIILEKEDSNKDDDIEIDFGNNDDCHYVYFNSSNIEKISNNVYYIKTPVGKFELVKERQKQISINYLL
jgi:hypothetical protein